MGGMGNIMSMMKEMSKMDGIGDMMKGMMGGAGIPGLGGAGLPGMGGMRKKR